MKIIAHAGRLIQVSRVGEVQEDGLVKIGYDYLIDGVESREIYPTEELALAAAKEFVDNS